MTSTTGDLRAFCATHLELPAAKKALAHLDSPTAALDTESLRAVLEAVITAVRATAIAHVELADNTATTCRSHAAALTSALRGLDDALTRISPEAPGPR